MDANDWRAQMLLSSRLMVVNKIFDTLKKRVPICHPEGLIQLKEIATRFEGTMYSVATSQSDYLRKISLKMLCVELNYRGNLGTNSLPSNSASGNGNPSNAGATPNMDDNDWRARLLLSSRSRIVDKIFNTLKNHLPISCPEGLVQLKEIAKRFEETVYAAATSQVDYLRKISVKMLCMRGNYRNHTMSNSSPSNSASGNGNPSNAALLAAKKRKLNEHAPESVKKRLRVVEFGNFLEKSGLQEDDESVCAVCLGCLNRSDKIRELCNCCHVFHRGCLDKWINRGHLTCPYCRSDL